MFLHSQYIEQRKKGTKIIRGGWIFLIFFGFSFYLSVFSFRLFLIDIFCCSFVCWFSISFNFDDYLLALNNVDIYWVSMYQSISNSLEHLRFECCFRVFFFFSFVLCTQFQALWTIYAWLPLLSLFLFTPIIVHFIRRCPYFMPGYDFST